MLTRGSLFLAAFAATSFCAASVCAQQPSSSHRNVIIFVADGLRHNAVTAEDMPTFVRVRTEGVNFANSHSVFPTFTTANASTIATGHGLGDTGDYSNVIWPGTWLTKPEVEDASGHLMPFLENDEVLANMNASFAGNYLGETTLLDYARAHGYDVASIGKLGPTAIQQIGSLGWSQDGYLDSHDAIVIDDATGHGGGFPLPADVRERMQKAGLMLDAPMRTNGYAESSQGNNGFVGDAQTPGTLMPNKVQQQWLSEVATQVVLPKFAEEQKPFVLLFWSRDPDATQHDEGDSLQMLDPGINGPSVKLALQNADHSLKSLLDWLDAHPAIKANTDVLLTSDHGFATISRRELDATGKMTGEPSAALSYEGSKEPAGTLPPAFLGIDLGIRLHLNVFDSEKRPAAGNGVYAQLQLSGEKSQAPLGSVLLASKSHQLDGHDAELMIASNGGSDLVYAPTHNTELVRQAVATLMQLDYVAAVFVNKDFCPTLKDCPGALPLEDVGLAGASKVPHPAVVVAFRHFNRVASDMLTGVQVSDTSLQEGQGMHGGFGRDQTLNNMAAIGPDFRAHFVDDAPVGNIDIVPTLAHILGFELPSTGSLKGRVASEALASGKVEQGERKRIYAEPASNGMRTLLEYQELDGVRYYDRGCLVASEKITTCE